MKIEKTQMHSHPSFEHPKNGEKNLIDFHPGDCKRKIENVRSRERHDPFTLFIDYFFVQFSFSRDVLNELMDWEMDL